MTRNVQQKLSERMENHSGTSFPDPAKVIKWKKSMQSRHKNLMVKLFQLIVFFSAFCASERPVWFLRVMPPRTTGVGRGFPTFRVRISIVYRYGRNLVQFPRREKDHIPVSCRQVRVHRRHGQELLPFP